MNSLNVVVWGENYHEQVNPEVAQIYPDGMHHTIAEGIRRHQPDFKVTTATLDQAEHGLTEQRLAETDVLVWWGHARHAYVEDAIVERIHQRVLQGMGLVVLHSGHYSKIFKRLMGTACSLTYRVADERERLWVCNPGHPIAAGIDRCIELDAEEMYGEPYAIPTPDEQVFISWFEGGEVFRSGCCWFRGNGRIFYFRPGHETYPTYHHQDIQRVIANGVAWARPQGNWKSVMTAECVAEPREKIGK